MTPEIIQVLVILGVAIILFVSEKLRVDLVAMLVLITLVLTGLVTTEEAFSGFASPAVITVWSVYIISGALFFSGVADILARFMLRIAGRSYIRILVVIMVTIGVMSAFMNNIGAVAILLPAVMSVARSFNVFTIQIIDSDGIYLPAGWKNDPNWHPTQYPGDTNNDRVWWITAIWVF